MAADTKGKGETQRVRAPFDRKGVASRALKASGQLEKRVKDANPGDAAKYKAAAEAGDAFAAACLSLPS